MYDYMEKEYTLFEQNLALAWASGNFSAWVQENQSASMDERKQMFFDCIEGGLSLALEFRKQNT